MGRVRIHYPQMDGDALAERFNRSFNRVVKEWGVSVSTYPAVSSVNTGETKLFDFSVQGTIGFASRIKIASLNGGSASAPLYKFKIVLSDGTVFYSAQSESTTINHIVNITPPRAGEVSGTCSIIMDHGMLEIRPPLVVYADVVTMAEIPA